MTRKATDKDIGRILDYLRPHYEECIYLYIDIDKYGTNNPNMQIWLDEEGEEIKLVIMKYHSGVSFFSDSPKWDAESVKRIINHENAKSVTARKDLIEELYSYMNTGNYDAEYGYCFRLTMYRDITADVEAEIPTDKELKHAAELVVSDEGIGSYYAVSDLAEQFRSRRDEGFGRNYIIKKEGRIIGHIASYAEHKDIATTAGLIIDPEYRDRMYGFYLEKYLMDDLIRDGYKVYTFVTERKRYKMLKAFGNEIICEYGKLILKYKEKK